MAQSPDFTVDDGDGTLLLSQLNTMFPALQTSSSGASSPANAQPGMLWFDTSVNPAVLKQRNAANDGWETLPNLTALNLLYQGLNDVLTSLANLSLTAGDLIHASGEDSLSAISLGSALQVLRVNAAGDGHEYVTPSVGFNPAGQLHNEHANRFANTVYQNTTNYMMFVGVQQGALGSGINLQTSPDGTTWTQSGTSVGVEFNWQYGVVAPSHYYRVTGVMAAISEFY